MGCVVCGEEIKVGVETVSMYKLGQRHVKCGPGSVGWLRRYGLDDVSIVLYHRKGGVSMSNEFCPEFGVGYERRASECIACEIVTQKLANDCKQKTELKAKEEKVMTTVVNNEGKGELVDVKGKVKKLSNLEFAKQLIASGLSKEEVIKQLKPIWINDGKDEKFAESRARSVYGSVKKLI